jgi:hypothetical protein
MSTDIIKFQNNVKDYQWGALNWFLMVTIPFMFATFVIWYLFHLRAVKEETLALDEAADLEKQQISGSLNVVTT